MKLSVERPDLAKDLISRSIEYSQRVERWEDAFHLAAYARHLDKCAEVLERSAPSLLADGRLETLETWLATCEAAADRPGCSLVRAEVLVRKGLLSEAAAIAQDIAQRLPQDNPHTCQSWCVAGQANHLLSNYEDALSCFLLAQQLAPNDALLKRSLWGSFLSAQQLALPESDSYLATLEQLPTQDLTDRLRLAVGKMQVAERNGSFAGVWSTFAPLMTLAPYSADPMACSAFLVNAAYLSVARAQYSTARLLSEEALSYCKRLGLQFAVGFCLALRAQAETGVRDFRRARQTVRQLERVIASQEDPHLHLDYRFTDLKLRLAEHGRRAFAHWSPDLSVSTASAIARADYAGLVALGMAATHATDEAQTHAELASTLGGCLQGRYYAAFARLIMRIGARGRDSDDRLGGDIEALIAETARVDFLDSVVVAYRACPDLLHGLNRARSFIAATAKRALLLGNDSPLAVRAGFPMPSNVQVWSDQLTKREREVLALLGEGLSNGEIAKRLVISASTAKIHVRHVLRKLGVTTRLQAALLARQGENTPE